MGLHHDHHSHSHAHVQQTSRTIGIAFSLNLTFAIIELGGGFAVNSMAILSDAIHDFGDSLSLGFAWYMARLSEKSADRTFTYGYKRFSLLSVLIIALILVLGSGFIIIESVQRFWEPQQSFAPGMIALAVLGIVINGIAGVILSRGSSLQESVLSWHFWEDVLGWLAVLAGGIVIYFSGIAWVDPLLSILLSIFVSYRVIQHAIKALSIFLQAVPSHFSIDEIQNRLKDELGLIAVHHTHVWTLDGQDHILTSHLVFPANSDLKEIIAIKAKAHHLSSQLGISHATFEVEIESADFQGKRENCP